MKRLPFLMAVLAVLAAGCSKNNPTTPAVDDTHIQFKATLLPANEAPTPVTGPEAAGSGLATIDFTLVRDTAGAITSGTVNFRVDVTGFPSTTAITAAHIHPGVAGATGSFIVSADVAPGQVVLTGGAVTFSRLSLAISAANAQAILNNPAGFYFNVHTSANPGGVMRGQLVKQ
jgi:cell wall-associated NlpC family hydrolase